MAGRFIDKEHGTDTTTAITDSASNRRKVRNLLDAAGLVWDRVSLTFKFNGNDVIKELADTSTAQTFTNKTLTSPTITTPTITGATGTFNALTGTIASEIVTTTNVITASESGTTYFLNAATEFASTLPSPAQGLFFRFIITNAPETASYTIGTAAAAAQIAGKIFGADGNAGDTQTAATATTVTFVDSKSTLGDMVEAYSDGTSWFVLGFCNTATDSITITG